MRRQTGKEPQQLAEAPELSAELVYLWQWFIDMNNTERGSGAMGIESITSASMMSWQWATGNYLQLWERKTLRVIDAVWVSELRKKND